MNTQEIVTICENKSLKEINNLIGLLKDLYHKKYYDTYVIIRIYPGFNKTIEIQKETGFNCYIIPSDTDAGRGTHIIEIPKEKWTRELQNELVIKYDDKW